MSQTKGLILAVLLGSFNFAVKAATLSFPEELIPITVNGKQVEHSLFSKKLDFDLPIGTHKVQIKYSDLYELDYDEHQTVSSAPFWVEVAITQDGQYQIGFDRAKDADAAERFAKAPSVYVIAPNKYAINYEQKEIVNKTCEFSIETQNLREIVELPRAPPYNRNDDATEAAAIFST